MSDKESANSISVVRKSGKSEFYPNEPIPKAAVQADYPLSNAQKRLWILDQMEEDSFAYNMPTSLELLGLLDFGALKRAFEAVIQRHESLRTVFISRNAEPRQKILPAIDAPINQIRIDPGDTAAAQIQTLFQRYAIEPFNLESGPLIRALLVKKDDTCHYLFINMHHIISDGWSIGVLVREINENYNTIVQGGELPDDPLAVQYKDYAVWQRQWLESERFDAPREFWHNRFADSIPVLDLPTDKPRPAVQTFNGAVFNTVIPEDETRRLNQLARCHNATLFMALLAVTKVLLYRYTGQEDIVVGTPVAGRSHQDLEDQIGFYVNMLALRDVIDGNLGFGELLDSIRENTTAAFENQDYPFDQLVEELDITRDTGRSPLFDVMVVLQNNEEFSQDLSTIRCNCLNLESSISKFDLTLSFSETSGGLSLAIEYNTNLFSLERIKRLAGYLKTLTSNILDQQDRPVSEVDILPHEEREMILHRYNETEADYPVNKTIHELFEQQVRQTPNNVAVVYEGQQLTYSQLNEKANQLARTLKNKGIDSNRVVGIMIPRSMEMIIGLIAILKAGGAYLPLDPEYPAARINYMLEDSRVSVLLTTDRVSDGILFDGEIVDITKKASFAQDAQNLGSFNKPEDLIYIIYTSGSTGNPKGVMLEHRTINNFIHGMIDGIDFQDKQSVLCLTTISFDIFVLETWLPLTKGMRIILADEREQKDSTALGRLLLNKKPEMIQLTPSRLQLLLYNAQAAECLKSVKAIMIGGEVLPMPLFQRLKAVYKSKIYNMYGPTETTVWSAIKDLTDLNHITLGHPINNTRIYILDQRQNPQPIGNVGELCIAGDGLARGYWNKPELTADRFVADPFFAGQRMYRTGDLARWSPDGDLVYQGRMDHQVKIRGYRIEPAEIENQLQTHPDVMGSAVIVHDFEPENKALVAYVVSKGMPSANEFREHLQKKLPDYMVPAHFVSIEEIPLTSNGKVDRVSLQKRKVTVLSDQKYIPPQTETEKELIGLWQEVLPAEKMGIRDNFFELGGNSLLAIKLAEKIHKKMRLECPVRDIFDHATVYELARALSDMRTSVSGNLIIPRKNQKRNTLVPLSNHQLIFWLIGMVTKETINEKWVCDVRGPLDLDQLEKSFNVLLQRHEILCCRFSRWRPFQKVLEPKYISLSRMDLRGHGLQSKSKALEKVMIEILEKPFNLRLPPLLRLDLVQYAEYRYKLLLVAPHDIIDEAGMQHLFDELVMLYTAFANGQQPPSDGAAIQFTDYVYWQHDVAEQCLQKDVAYWQQTLKGASLLRVPNSFLLNPGEIASSHVVKLDSALLRQLGRIGQQHKVSLPMALSVIVAITLHRITQQSDICLTTTYENRTHDETKNLIAPLVIPVPIRIRLSVKSSFPKLARQIRDRTFEAYEHVESAWTIPRCFLHRNHRGTQSGIVTTGHKMAVRFMTWLLCHMIFAPKAYMALFYAFWGGDAHRVKHKKMSNSGANSIQPVGDGIDVVLNFLPNFNQNSDATSLRCGDVRFTTEMTPTSDKPGKGIFNQQSNLLQLVFSKDHEGNPMLNVMGMRFNVEAHQEIAAIFIELLERTVNNSNATLQELLTFFPTVHEGQ